MIKYLTYCLLFCSLIWWVNGCRPLGGNGKGPSDKVLAQVHNKLLYLSDMEGMFPENSSPKDSSMIMNAFIEQWVRDNVLMYEAERNIPSDLNIDELVRDYRASLIRHNFEKNMVDILLDSTITQQELTTYYQNNKEQYRLATTILRCHLIKIPKTATVIPDLRKRWNQNKPENYNTILDYCSNFAEVYMLEDSTWYKIEDIALQLPKGTLIPGNAQANREFTVEDADFRYFFRILESVEKQDIAPLSYVKNQASKVILHNRKIDLLQVKREEMYERELRRNNVKVFVER